MSVLAAALITYFSIFLMTRHLSPLQLRRMAGYAGWFDLLLHGTILYVFMGTSTLGLLQAELSGLMISISLRGYRHFNGYERFVFARMRWVRYAGTRTNITLTVKENDHVPVA